MTAPAGHDSGHQETHSNPDLSVVVVTYNEADRIEACLDALFETCDGISSYEVVLVDSRSTDGTVDIARSYPVSIYRLPPSVETTPGAGRYVGTELTSADRILFVDGDMVLEPSWLGEALEVLDSAPAIAGVDGHLNGSTARESRTVTSLRGVALYDRAALTAVGGFDPHLSALEDIELGFRFDEAGYRLVRTPTVAANHPFESGFGEQLRRWQSGYYHGLGEVLRKSLGSPSILGKVLYRYRQYGLGGIWALCGPVSVAVGAAGIGLWVLLTVVGLVGLVALLGIEGTARKVVSFLPVYLGACLGFLGAHPSPSAFPVDDVELVHRGSQAIVTDPTSGL